MATEVELKFEMLSNSQFKFLSIDKADALIRKVSALCKIIGIEFDVGHKSTKEIVDTYYDDASLTLNGLDSSIRVRRGGGSGVRITYKSPQIQGAAGPLLRTEIEIDCSDDEIPTLLSDISLLWKRLKVDGCNVPIEGGLIEMIAVHNSRLSVPMKTSVGSYEFCYDKYFYYNGEFSDIFAEIEIESIGQYNGQSDEQMVSMSSALPSLFEYSPHKSSKFARGIKWAQGEVDAAKTAYTVMFDIVGYSILTADVQKQVILNLNHHTKEVINDKIGQIDKSHIAYIPTGDGMILVFFDSPERILPVVIELQHRIKQYNATAQHPIKFRSAMHAGQVFKYSDINENHNYAGSGINIVARAIGFADTFQIIATKEAFDAMGGTSKSFARYFHGVGRRTVKHGVVIDLYNVYDRQSGFGNPAPPTP